MFLAELSSYRSLSLMLYARIFHIQVVGPYPSTGIGMSRALGHQSVQNVLRLRENGGRTHYMGTDASISHALRSQPQHSADERQRFRSYTVLASAAAGSHR